MKLFKDESQKIKIHRIYLLVSASLIFSGVIVGLTLDGFGALRYFTYLSNVLLVAYFLYLFSSYGKNEILNSYFSMSVIIAILITCLVYNFILAPFTDFGPVFSSNESFARNYQNSMSHLFSMGLVLVNYFIFEKKGYFKYTHILVGMIFPLLYWLVFVTIGGIINFYPYFFMDIPILGWNMAILWFIILLAAFAIIGFLLFIIDGVIGKKRLLKQNKENI